MANDHFTVSISSLNNGLNDDRQSVSGYTLTEQMRQRSGRSDRLNARPHAPA
jgi:hypothetical protein